MSRGFVKEDDQEENPIIPNRAPLPAGAANYVTANGLKELILEQESLEAERKAVPAEESPEKRSALKVINGKLNMLIERINSAEVVDLSEIESDEIRFGAIVTFQFSNESQKRIFQIVGVDEADVKEKKIAFTSPIAKALMGKKTKENTQLQLENGTKDITIHKIEYPSS
ncbi:transcription elongation factor GreA [Cryomorpha ignava]|uniref:Transcription elongation factor GreA n=1 Tax=Cryomorpha ignava TaxID=101383 RepID=A0A7K3WXA8_9FLAO|nr:GreA/GreB family elongation factor [Cryomorpha ignava]NEN25492.1 transcription elongation factor GreA [Cryomorpha ignava]